MQIVEEYRAKAIIAKEHGNEKDEEYYLKMIIGIYAWKNDQYWDIADFLYSRNLNNLVKKASSTTLKKLTEQLHSVKKQTMFEHTKKP